MPRKANLNQTVPNRFYQIDATVKYQHVADNVITAVIQQGDVQTKISIPKEGIELEEGKQYNFQKCFKSKNGWLYAKNPAETVIEKDQSRLHQNCYSLRQLFQERQKFANHYIDAVLKVISIEPKQEVKKNDENLVLYNMKCFQDGLFVNVQIWNQEIKADELKNKVAKFVGFKVKPTSHQTITLHSTVYSKIQKLTRLPLDREKYAYNPNTVYKNVSSFYEIRTIEELEIECEQRHKNYSIITAQINQSEELEYEGCSKCKKKIQDNKCYQCGSKIKKQNYKYIKIVLQDDTSMLECAVFDEEYLKKIKQLGQNQKAYFFVKSSAKKNQQTGEFFTSNVVTQVKSMKNSE